MITLIRWFIIKSKKIKYELMLWQFIENVFNELSKNPEEIEKKIMNYVDKITISDTNTKTKT